MTLSRTHRDVGLTLIELIVVVVVAGLVVSLLAVTFVNGLTSQQRAAARNAATAQLNAITAAITESIRNSTNTDVSEGGQRLDVTVLERDGTWECRAWHVTGGELRYSAGDAARSADPTGWRSLASVDLGHPIGTAAFEEVDGRLLLRLRLTEGEVTVAVTNGAKSQVVMQGGPEC